MIAMIGMNVLIKMIIMIGMNVSIEMIIMIGINTMIGIIIMIGINVMIGMIITMWTIESIKIIESLGKMMHQKITAKRSLVTMASINPVMKITMKIIIIITKITVLFYILQY